jgi:hypothetical protein
MAIMSLLRMKRLLASSSLFPMSLKTLPELLKCSREYFLVALDFAFLGTRKGQLKFDLPGKVWDTVQNVQRGLLGQAYEVTPGMLKSTGRQSTIASVQKVSSPRFLPGVQRVAPMV